MKIDHVQLAAPEGGEDAARAYFSQILGLQEETKPAVLQKRGGVWFRGPEIAIHVGIEADFTPQKKAHVALSVSDIEGLAGRLQDAGYPVRWDKALPERRRFYTDDPFGNRLELIASADGFLPQQGRALWQAVDSYFEAKLLQSDRHLEQALESSSTAGLPRWEVSPLQAQFLAVLIKATRTRRVLEVGTLGGYSTIFLARAIPENGTVVTLEVDARHATVAQSNIAAAGLQERVEVIIGAAARSMEQLVESGVEPFDMVFVDADKKSNREYMRLARELVRPGALIITDNVVRGGAVVRDGQSDEDTTGVRNLMDSLHMDATSLSSAIQTVGSKGYDGFAITVVL